MAAHSERDLIPSVIQCLTLKQNCGRVSFAQLRAYLEVNFPFNADDWKPLPSLGCPTWHQRLRNLKSNKTLMLDYWVKEVHHGFQVRA